MGCSILLNSARHFGNFVLTVRSTQVGTHDTGRSLPPSLQIPLTDEENKRVTGGELAQCPPPLLLGLVCGILLYCCRTWCRCWVSFKGAARLQQLQGVLHCGQASATPWWPLLLQPGPVQLPVCFNTEAVPAGARL